MSIQKENLKSKPKTIWSDKAKKVWPEKGLFLVHPNSSS